MSNSVAGSFRYVIGNIRDIINTVTNELTSIQNSPFSLVNEDSETGWRVLRYVDPRENMNDHRLIRYG